MKEKIKLEDIVKNTYQEYKIFKEVFDRKKENKGDQENFILEFVKSGKKIDNAFKEKVKEFYSMEPKYVPELLYRQNKFIESTEVFLKTKDEDQELDKDILSAYLVLEKSTYKPKYIIDKNDFKLIKEDDEDTPDFTKDYFDVVYKTIENLIQK